MKGGSRHCVKVSERVGGRCGMCADDNSEKIWL